MNPSSRVKVGFATSEAAISRAIRLGTRSAVSHVFLVFEDETLGGWYTLEAEWNGVVVRPYELAERTSKVVALVEPVVPIDHGLRAVAGRLGAPYDFRGFFGMAWVLLCRVFGRHPCNPLQSARAFFCSELATLALQAAQYPGADKLDASATSPGDLYRFLRDGGCEGVLAEKGGVRSWRAKRI